MNQTNSSGKVVNFVKKNDLLLISITLFIVLFIYFFIHAAGPLGSDELLYADAGLQGYGNYIVMNRYTHIYLQLLFMRLAPTNLIGMNLFWAFVMSVTSVSVFILGRIVRKNNNNLHGFFALLIFLSLNLFWKYFGIPIVDITPMMIMTIYFLVVYFYLDKRTKNWPLICLGFLFIVGFKAKEFAIVLLFTLPIFGIDENGRFDWKLLARNFAYYILGILLGVLLLILLNTVILHDPLFGFSIKDWILFKETLDSFIEINPTPDSYLSSFFLSVYYFPFILYLLSYFKHRKNIAPSQIILWILPIVYIIMVTLTMVKSGWRTDERYIFPIIGLMCALAPQFFSFPLPQKRQEKTKYFLYLITAVVVFLIFRQLLYWFTNYIEVSFSTFIISYGFNIFFLLLLIGISIFIEGKIINNVIVIFFLLINLYFPLSINFKTSVRGDIAKDVAARFEPLAAFDGQIDLCNSITYTLSNQILETMRIKQDLNEAAGIFNLYYDKRLDNSGFNFYEKYSKITETISSTDTDYILLTASEWEDLQNSETQGFKNYQSHIDSSGQFILLEKTNRNICP